MDTTGAGAEGTGRDLGRVGRSAMLAATLIGGVSLYPWAVDPFGGAMGPAGRALPVLVLWSYVGCGLLARKRWPHERTGLLLLGTGALWGLALLVNVQRPVPYTVGLVAVAGIVWCLIRIILTYGDPTHGRRVARVVAVANHLTLVGWGVAVPLTYDPNAHGCTTCPPDLNLLALPVPARTLAVAVTVIGTITLAALVGMCVVVVMRWRGASPVARWQLAPVYAPALVAAFAIIAYLLMDNVISPVNPSPPLSKPGPAVLSFVLGMGALPFGILAGSRRHRSQRTAVGDVIGRLTPGSGIAALEEALRAIVGDPSLTIVAGAGVSPSADAGDEPGPRERGDVATVELVADGVTVGWLLHDPALAREPELLHAVGSLCNELLAHMALKHQLEEQLAEVARSRRRIVAAADETRRRIERDLHDGAQQRLVVTSLAVRDALRVARVDAPDLAGRLALAADELDAALAELRELARGMYPTVLTTSGLAGALEWLALRSPVPVRLQLTDVPRLARPHEVAAWFLAMEGITNAVRHARCREITITIRTLDARLEVSIADDGCGGADARGGGLRGLADRVAALDGELAVSSPVGAGTVLTATLPLRPPLPGDGEALVLPPVLPTASVSRST